MKTTSVILGALLAAAGGFGFGRYVAGRTAPPTRAAAPVEVRGPSGDAQYRIVVGGDPQRGPEDALVTVVEYVDYTVPGIGDPEPILEGLLKRYRGKVRRVVKHNPDPQRPFAMDAARAALAAHAQEKFWPMHARLLAHPDALKKVDLEAHAKAIGLDVVRFKATLAEETNRSLLGFNMREASRFGLQGAPMFFVNGYPLRGPQKAEAFTRIIDREIPIVDRLRQSGIPLDRLYAERLRDARRTIDDPGRRAGGPSPVPPSQVEDPGVRYKVPIDGAPVRGPETALVTIVELTDFECPFCKRVRTTLDEVERAYAGKVRLVHLQRPLPMHPNASSAAEAALEAHAQGKYWRMEAALFDKSALTADAIGDAGREAGLDVGRLQRAVERHTHQARIQATQELADRLGARGTPTFFINGRKLTGAVPIERFRMVIDEELAVAERTVREEHVPPRAVYAHLTKNGAESLRLVSTGAPAAPAIKGRPAIRALPIPGVAAPELVPGDPGKRSEGH